MRERRTRIALNWSGPTDLTVYERRQCVWNGYNGVGRESPRICAGARQTARSLGQMSTRRDGRVVDGGGLENHCTRKGTGGSNPSPSAKSFRKSVDLAVGAGAGWR